MKINKRIRLVHIGLIKTATTSMQELWFRNPKTCLIHHGMLPLVEKARLEGRNPQKKDSLPLTWKFDYPPGPDQQIVISQEALSTAYINERAQKSEILAFQEIAARLTSQVVPESKILITVRAPDRWIKSAYNQTIRQGSTNTFPQFLALEKDFIKQSLNVIDLLGIWKKFFGKDNVLVLPIELMWQDKEKFYDAIFEFSGLPAPDFRLSTTANSSLGNEHLKLMREFNEWVDLFSRHGIYQGKIPHQVNQALSIIRFAVHRSLESPSLPLDEKLAEVEAQLPDCKVDTGTIDRDFLTDIKSSYKEFLDQTAFQDFRVLYT
ncbi:MAG: hypothetical protein RQ741_10855 [Wenzhouxiangellaceae bacterium]|nr:hypothetical protein [Wenzhouxiangellaceae bacterium]